MHFHNLCIIKLEKSQFSFFLIIIWRPNTNSVWPEITHSNAMISYFTTDSYYFPYASFAIALGEIGRQSS